MFAEMSQENKFRSDRDVQRLAAEIVGQLGEIVKDAADRLALAWDESPNVFTRDEAADVLTWQLYEFLFQQTLERNADIFDGMAKAHQIDEPHARSWFMDDQDDEAEGFDTRQPRQEQPLYEYCSVEINPGEQPAAKALYRLFDAGWQPTALVSAYHPIDEGSFSTIARLTLRRDVADDQERPQMEYCIIEVDHSTDDDVEELGDLCAASWRPYMQASVFGVNPFTDELHNITTHILRRERAAAGSLTQLSA